ncbi:MAG TPA: aspartyl protease family protein, partial [Caulobacter sp.]|nr:aspartyl protease family protein [Caulobacter sp.]
SAAEAESARRRDLLVFDDALRGAGGARVSLAATEVFDGASVSVLHVTFGGPDAYDLLIDPATGALKAERRLEDGRTILVRYDDWRTVEGVRMPFVETLEEAGDPIKRRLTFTAMDIDPVVSPTVWSRPADRAVASFAPGARATAPLPFEFFLGSRIYIPATVAGRTTHVLLDSGAETTVLDSRFAEAAGIKVSGVVTAVGTGGRQEAQLASGVTIRIGEVALRDLTVALVDLSAIEQMIGRPIPVILGKEVLNALTVDLDFQGKTIAFEDPARFTPPAGAVEVPVTSANGIRSVPVSIEGGPPIQVDFDLGNGSAFLAYSAWWKPAGTLSDGRPVSQTLSGAIGGLKTRSIASLRAVTFAGVTFRNVPTVFFDDDGQSAESNRTFGNVGMPILSRFRLTTDYSRDRLFLTPLPDAATRPFAKDRAGVLARPARDGKAEILLVAPGSPAEAAGLKTGETITAVNGLALTGNNAQAIGAIRALPAGSSVSFTLSTGEIRTVVLKDYF